MNAIKTLVAASMLSAIPIDGNTATISEIKAENTRAIVYLQVETATGDFMESGTGFIVSHDGFVITAGHIKADPGQKIWAVIGQRYGTRLPLSQRDIDTVHDTSLYRLPQSATCRYAATLSDQPVQENARILGMGFPGTDDGVTATPLNLVNLSAGDTGYYKADGFLRPGYSGGPIFDENGKVIAIVSSGDPSGGNNDLVPISFALALLRKNGAQVGLNTPAPFADSCYAFCRAAENGVESWNSDQTVEETRNISESGHNPGTECAIAMTARLQMEPPGSRTELYPGQGQEHVNGLSESYTQDILGHGTYHYHCRYHLRSGPTFVRKQSPVCGLWAAP